MFKQCFTYIYSVSIQVSYCLLQSISLHSYSNLLNPLSICHRQSKLDHLLQFGTLPRSIRNLLRCNTILLRNRPLQIIIQNTIHIRPQLRRKRRIKPLWERMLEPRLVHTGCIGHNATLSEFIVDGRQTFAPKDLAPLVVSVACGSTHGQGDDGPFLKCEDDRGVIVDTGLLELLEGGGSSGEYAFNVVIQGIPDVIDIMSLCGSTFLTSSGIGSM
jgi:hypothetical protein